MSQFDNKHLLYTSGFQPGGRDLQVGPEIILGGCEKVYKYIIMYIIFRLLFEYLKS